MQHGRQLWLAHCHDLAQCIIESCHFWRGGFHALMILAPMKTRTILCCMFAEILFPPSIHPTTIVVVVRNGIVYVGADSKRSETHASGEIQAGPTVCKVQKYGTVLIAHFGTGLLRVETKSASPVILFDGDRIEREAMKHSGTLIERADRLEGVFWTAYRRAIINISKMEPKLQPGTQQMMRNIDFVLAGKGSSGLPEAIVLRFATDFNQLHPIPQKTRLYLPHDGTGFVVGVRATDPLNIGNTEIESAILNYLAAASRAHPDVVGPPFTIARVSSDGQITYDQAGACH